MAIEIVDLPIDSMVMFNSELENGHRNRWFTHWTWWFYIDFCMFTRGYIVIISSILVGFSMK
jgi:hypothetical protein